MNVGLAAWADHSRGIGAIAYRTDGNDFNEIFTIFLALSCVIQQQQISELSGKVLLENIRRALCV
jgi:hypothetical protein